MNWQHFKTFMWLRWRLRANQLRRGGTANIVLLGILYGLGAFAAAGGFVGLFFVGLFALPKAPPPVHMYAWDGLVVMFLIIWLTGLLTELQRAEALSLDRFLHLPVSLTSAFLINYLSSLVSPTMILFLPAMVGLCLGLVGGKGAAMLWLLPLLAAFMLMVTALTYQFQGWLAALMVNKRRRRTVIMIATLFVIVISQLPNLINIAAPWNRYRPFITEAELEEQAKFRDELKAGKIDVREFQRRLDEQKRASKAKAAEEDRETKQKVEQTTTLVNAVVPPGWLPLGAMGLAEGNVLPALLGTLGLGLIGAGSLWRSYRTTLRLYTGQFTKGKRRPAAAPTTPAAAAPRPAVSAGPAKTLLIERTIPGISEQAAAIAMSSLRSLLRAPEAKMMFLTPVIMMLIFGSMFLARAGSGSLPIMVRPLFATGGMAMIMLTMGQLLVNQFGFDRSGFRVFVLCSAPRRDILLGKNLAFAPLAFGLGVLVVTALQVVYPMRFDHFLAALVQFVSLYLLYCLIANWLSIFAPLPIAAGSMRPAHPKLVPILLQIAFTFLFPFVVLPTVIPLGIEFLLQQFGWPEWVPVNLVLSLVVCAVVVLIYWLVLKWQGDVLQRREQQILETVTTKAE